MDELSIKRDIINSWISKAKADLSLAKVGIFEDVTYDELSFHAQQAVEKSVKAVLYLFNIDFPRTHNIGSLVELLPPNIPIPDFLKNSVGLSAYAFTVRYPGDYDSVAEEDWREAALLASQVVNWTENLIKNTGIV